MRTAFATARLLVAAAIFTAVAAQFFRSMQNAGPQFESYVAVNFFSFFTIESNLLAATALVTTVVFAEASPRWLPALRLTAAAYMLTTGVVYNTLLRGIALPQGETVEWANEILHVVAPILIVLEWIASSLAAPRWRALWVVAAFPVVWAGYTLVRGAVAIDPRTNEPWYPYPFLDPSNFAGGYLGVAGYVAVIAVVIVGGAAVLLWLRRLLARRVSAGVQPARRSA